MAKPKRNINVVEVFVKSSFLVVDGDPELLAMIKKIEGVRDVKLYDDGTRANVEVNTCYGLFEVIIEIEGLDAPIPEAFLETGEAK